AFLAIASLPARFLLLIFPTGQLSSRTALSHLPPVLVPPEYVLILPLAPSFRLPTFFPHHSPRPVRLPPPPRARQVRAVKITQRVMDTYYARVYLAACAMHPQWNLGMRASFPVSKLVFPPSACLLPSRALKPILLALPALLHSLFPCVTTTARLRDQLQLLRIRNRRQLHNRF
ncbi:unnamed protein product, partial [Closterium sp. NIES-54]